MSTFQPTRSRQAFIWIAFAGLVTLAIVAVMITIYAINAPYQRVIREAENLAELESHPLFETNYFDLRRPAPTDQPNATDLIEAARVALGLRYLRRSEVFPETPGAIFEGDTSEEFEAVVSSPEFAEAIESLMRITPDHVIWAERNPSTLVEVMNDPRPDLAELKGAADLLVAYSHVKLREGDVGEAERALTALSYWAVLEPHDPDFIGFLLQSAITTIATRAFGDYLTTVGISERSASLVRGWLERTQQNRFAQRALTGEFHLGLTILNGFGSLTSWEVDAESMDEPTELPIPFLRRDAVKEAYRIRFLQIMNDFYPAVVAWENGEPQASQMLTDFAQKMWEREASSNRADFLIRAFLPSFDQIAEVLLRRTDAQCIGQQGIAFLQHTFGSPAEFSPAEEFFANCQKEHHLEPLRVAHEDGLISVYIPRTFGQMRQQPEPRQPTMAFQVRLDNSPDPRVQAYWAWLEGERISPE